MSKIVVASPRVRSGKTTTALYLAHGFALLGLKTLVLDFCPIGTLSRILGCFRAERQPSVASILAARGDLTMIPATTLVSGIRSMLDIVPSGEDVRGQLQLIEEQDPTQVIEFLQRTVDQLSQSYDIVVCDTPSGLNCVNRSLCGTAEAVVVPVNDPLNSALGFSQLLEATPPRPFGDRTGPIWGITRVQWSDTNHRLPSTESKAMLRDQLLLMIEQFVYQATQVQRIKIQRPRVRILAAALANNETLQGLADCHLTAFDLGNRQLSMDLLSEKQRDRLARLPTGAPQEIARSYMSLVEEVMAILEKAPILSSPPVRETAQ